MNVHSKNPPRSKPYFMANKHSSELSSEAIFHHHPAPGRMQPAIFTISNGRGGTTTGYFEFQHHPHHYHTIIIWRRYLALETPRLRHLRPLLFILPLREPQLLERPEGAKDGPPNPHAEPPLDGRRGQRSNLQVVAPDERKMTGELLLYYSYSL